jgi:uncharacterized protein (DUF1778 family)
MPATARTEKLDLRLTPRAKRVLQSAASAANRSVSEFVLESALARAEETLPDRQHFGLDAEQWTAFLKAAWFRSVHGEAISNHRESSSPPEFLRASSTPHASAR